MNRTIGHTEAALREVYRANETNASFAATIAVLTGTPSPSSHVRSIGLSSSSRRTVALGPYSARRSVSPRLYIVLDVTYRARPTPIERPL